ncbi:uncharacterized protein LOC144618356 [Crassostrea virginica]
MFPSGKLYSRKERRPKDFSKSWRVDEMGIDTIYSGVCTDEVNTVIPPVPVFCDCNLGSAPVCGADLDISSCTKPDKKSRKKKKGLVGEDVTEVMIQQATSPPSHCLSRAALVLFEFNATYISRDFTWPTPTNITEVQAFQKCKTTVEASVAFQGCKNVPDIGFSVSLDSCVIDIQIMDDLVWAEEALTSIIQQCQTQLEVNTELWVNVSGEIAPNPTIIDNL